MEEKQSHGFNEANNNKRKRYNIKILLELIKTILNASSLYTLIM